MHTATAFFLLRPRSRKRIVFVSYSVLELRMSYPMEGLDEMDRILGALFTFAGGISEVDKL